MMDNLKDFDHHHHHHHHHHLALSKRKRQMCSCASICRKLPLAIVLTSLVLLCITAFFKWMALDWVVDQQIAQRLQLVPGSDAWNKWKDIPVPIIIRFRIFNVTNPVAVQNGAKPRLAEAGPYAYEEKRIKDIIAVDSEKDTITYRQRIIYKFRPDLSNGTEYDRLVVINVPFVTLSKLTYDNVGNFSFAHALADRNMRQRGERLFTYATVKEYMFDGYSVQHYLNFLKSPAVSLVGRVKIPKSIETGRFGFYLGKNNSDDGEYVIRSGKNNPQEFGQIVSWNGKTKLDYYSGICNLINGTDGSIAPPFITKDTLIRFFSSDICRSVFVHFKEELEINGIRAYRFKMPDAKLIFDHPDFCFCPKGKNNECFKYGVLSMAPCRDDAPIALSGAHFLESYHKYQDMVVGLKPIHDKHETRLDIEPKTGVILRAAKRVQFNVMVHPNRDMTTFANVRPTLFPFMWVEEMVEPNEVLTNQLQQQLFAPVEMANQASVGGMALLTCMLLFGLLGMAWFNTGHRKPSSIHSDHSDSFHASSRHTMRSTSPSLISSLSVGNSSHISSISQRHLERHHSTGGPKSLPLSIVSMMSRGTMTSGNQSKSTMTDGINFDLADELKRINLQDKYSPSRMGSIVNTADVVAFQQRHIERKDSSNMESYDNYHISTHTHGLPDAELKRSRKLSATKKYSVATEPDTDVTTLPSSTSSSTEGVDNTCYEGDNMPIPLPRENDVDAATRRCSEFVNNQCSGRRRKFEPKYATINI